MADTPILRINPLPGRRLGTAELTEAVRALAESQRVCASLSDAACAELYDLAAEAVGRDRQRVLELKRAIYNHRQPAAAVRDHTWPAATSAWLDAWQRNALARGLLTTGYDTCLAGERAALAETVGSQPFQLSLALTSPRVFDAVRHYARSAGSPSKQDRKSERGILQHLTRAMVRTSPLTQFTAVGFATWADQGVAFDRMAFRRHHAHSVPSMDRVLLSAMVAGLLPDDPASTEGADDCWKDDFALQHNKSLRIVQSSVRFRHHSATQIRVLSTPLTSHLRVLLNLTSLGAVPARSLRRALMERLGVSADDADAIVRGASEAQILVPGPVLDEQAEDPLSVAQQLLRAQAPAAATELEQVSAELARFPTAKVTERVALLQRLDSAQQKLNELSSRPITTHVNEAYVLEPFEVSPVGYETAFQDLATVTEFASLFDLHHHLRTLVSKLFVDRFGAGASVSLVDHAADLVVGVVGREEKLTLDSAEEFGPSDGSLAQLLKLRMRAADAVAERISRHAAEQPDAEELPLDPAWLAELASSLPERFRRSAASYGLLVQPVGGRLVVNACYPGYGMLGARFLGTDRELGGGAAGSVARRTTALFSADGAQPCEDRGLHRANINQRIPLLERTITPEEWIGFRLVHDVDGDELAIEDAQGTRIRPVSLGMAWSELLPAPLRLAMWLAESGRLRLEALFEKPAAAAASNPERTWATPRLTVGSVVLQRRRWYPGADFPAVPGTDGPAGHLVDLTAWRAAHSVPEEVLIKSGFSRTSSNRDGWTRDYLANRRREKPQYVDLASALAVRVLPRLLARRAPGSFFEEALPGVHTGRHAFEWVVELDRPAGATFQMRTP
ncbi:lantibiotic dehydratase [Streptomyces griseorubiginosus]|uniref:lantibiotic dehydratase n=1 Tax=Streptomyces griseorubiginosus TaxID=67304 RepID=UPI0036E72090